MTKVGKTASNMIVSGQLPQFYVLKICVWFVSVYIHVCMVCMQCVCSIFLHSPSFFSIINSFYPSVIISILLKIFFFWLTNTLCKIHKKLHTYLIDTHNYTHVTHIIIPQIFGNRCLRYVTHCTYTLHTITHTHYTCHNHMTSHTHAHTRKHQHTVIHTHTHPRPPTHTHTAHSTHTPVP